MGALIALVQPLAAVELEDAAFLVEELGKRFLNIRFLLSYSSLVPPLEAYDWSRGQYVSDRVLSVLEEHRRRVGVDIVLGVAGIDAYTDGLNFVFGQAIVGGGVAVVYTPRLRPEYYGGTPDQGVYRQRLLKEAMHELGHALGLGHCSRRRCVMSFSNSIAEVDAKEPRFCPDCAARLNTIGVKLSPDAILPDGDD